MLTRDSCRHCPSPGEYHIRSNSNSVSCCKVSWLKVVSYWCKAHSIKNEYSYLEFEGGSSGILGESQVKLQYIISSKGTKVIARKYIKTIEILSKRVSKEWKSCDSCDCRCY